MVSSPNWRRLQINETQAQERIAEDKGKWPQSRLRSMGKAKPYDDRVLRASFLAVVNMGYKDQGPGTQWPTNFLSEMPIAGSNNMASNLAAWEWQFHPNSPMCRFDMLHSKSGFYEALPEWSALMVRDTQHLCRQGSQVMSPMSSWTSRAQTMAMAMGWVTSAPVAPVAVAPMAVVTVVRPTATGTMAVVWVSMVRGGIQNMGMTRSVMTMTIEEAAEDRMPLGSTGWMKSVRNVQAPLCCLGPRANWERSGNWHKAK